MTTRATSRSEHRSPPYDVEAEEAALGAAMLDAGAAAVVVAELKPSDFYGPQRRLVFEALAKLAADGEPIDATTVADRLRSDATLGEVGGKPYLHNLVNSCPAPANVAAYARIVRRDGERRELISIAQELAAHAIQEPEPDLVRGRALLALERGESLTRTARVVGGASFALDVPEHEAPVWGRGAEVIWAPGEVLLVVGPPGVGKTTLSQRVALALAGHDTHVLGLPVAHAGRPVLYVAADRPKQAARSLRRMIDEPDRARLDERMLVHRGPLGYDLAREPERLAAYALELGVGAVVIDSLKDVAAKLSEDETGSGMVRAWNALLAADVEVCCLHHQRKGRDGAKPTTLEDVYGSAWLSAGAGSVVLLWGAAGDPVVELSHLKQPAEDVGPLWVDIDHDRGAVSVATGDDLLAHLRRAPAGMTAQDAARSMFGTPTPTRAQVARARRKLERLVSDRYAMRLEGDTTRGAVRDHARYVAAAPEGMAE